MAPEIISGKYNEKCDIWSCGVILYIMLSGNTPFDGKDEYEILEKIRKAKFSMNDYVWSKISDSAKHLVKRMLEIKPSNRISATEALKHPWIEFVASKQEDVNLKMTKMTLNRLKNFKVICKNLCLIIN